MGNEGAMPQKSELEYLAHVRQPKDASGNGDGS